jgi:general L-amino acid transport system permease protein
MPTPPQSNSSPTPIPFWRTQAYWRGVTQLVALAVVAGSLFFFIHNVWQNLQQSGLGLSFAPFRYQAGFDIPEAVIAYDPRHSYWRALLVGLVNSLRVIGLAMILATALGVSAGIASFSSNWLVRQIITVYIETVRNLPLLVQLLFVYGLLISLPQSGTFLGITWSKEGWQLWGDLTLSYEFLAILLGLAVYTGTFIAEIVRGGIRSVPKGQWEAASSLGFNPWQTMQLIILPQALRVMIPSLANQYLNLAKNSSLAIAVGYPDLYRVSQTIMNQTGRAVEVMVVIMVCYLTLSLLIAFLLNLYNRRVQLASR